MPHMNMGRHIVGIGFCGIAAFLYAVDQIVIAGFACLIGSRHDGPAVAAAERFSGDWLVALAVVALVLGVAFLVCAEVTARRSGGQA